MDIKIRSWKMDDAETLAYMIGNKKVQDNLRELPYPYTVLDAKEYLLSAVAADMQKTFEWAITADDKLVGSIGAFRKDNIHRLTAEMGYFVAEEHWGKGIVTEAVKLACSYVFENSDIVRIFAEPYAHNDASCRVLEKAGFTYEGTMRKNALKNGQLLDMKMYAIIREK